MMIPAFATGLDISPYAEGLNVLGIVRGTGNGFELHGVPTRSEILVMIIRLLGKEQQALENSYPHTFEDTKWEEPYVSFTPCSL
ncbi:MAG TPA: hypothetical protein GXX20_00300 [Clostridiaceae bacterium]|nr:hypothetical protein [Clostridiaceae bacterium]